MTYSSHPRSSFCLERSHKDVRQVEGRRYVYHHWITLAYDDNDLSPTLVSHVSSYKVNVELFRSVMMNPDGVCPPKPLQLLILFLLAILAGPSTLPSLINVGVTFEMIFRCPQQLNYRLEPMDEVCHFQSVVNCALSNYTRCVAWWSRRPCSNRHLLQAQILPRRGSTTLLPGQRRLAPISIRVTPILNTILSFDGLRRAGRHHVARWGRFICDLPIQHYVRALFNMKCIIRPLGIAEYVYIRFIQLLITCMHLGPLHFLA